jgi:outer membrane immunogenic protein
MGETGLESGRVGAEPSMKFVKSAVVIGGVALALLSSLASWSARAADLTPYPAAPAAPGYIPARYSWTGFYLGVTAGDGWGTGTFIDPFPGGGIVSPSLNGFLVGGYGGFNYQINYVVLGVEGDFIGSWSKGSATDVNGNSLQIEALWTASITGRVGIAFDRLLLYVKGGGAFMLHRDTVTIPATSASPTGSAYPSGWTIGGGLDYAFTDHWIARVEYDYLNFPARGLQVSSPIGNTQVGVKFNQAKGGIAYKF